MVRQKSLRIVGAISFGLASLALLSSATKASEDAGLVICRYIVERTGEMIRSGDVPGAMRNKADLEKCVPILNDALKNKAQAIVDRYNNEAAPRR